MLKCPIGVQGKVPIPRPISLLAEVGFARQPFFPKGRFAPPLAITETCFTKKKRTWALIQDLTREEPSTYIQSQKELIN